MNGNPFNRSSGFSAPLGGPTNRAVAPGSVSQRTGAHRANAQPIVAMTPQAFAAPRSPAANDGASTEIPSGSGSVPTVLRASELAEGPFWYKAAIVYDGDSDEFAEFFERRVEILDRISGRAIYFAAIGDPRVCGRLYEEYRTEARAAKDAAEAVEHDTLVERRGTAAHHRRRETSELASMLGIDPKDLPCIAFLTTPIHEPVPILRIEREWLRVPALVDALSSALQRHLSEEEVLGVGVAGETTIAELVDRLQPILEAIHRDMASATAGLASSAPSRRPSGSRIEIPTPANATWDLIRIEFLDGHSARVTVRGGWVGAVDCRDVGLADRRTQPARPNRSWRILEEFADGRGELRWHTVRERAALEKRLERLSVVLRDVFRIDDPPFKLDRRARCWRSQFSIHPEN